MEVQVLQVSKMKYKVNINMMTVISNLDLLMLVITVHLMPNVFYVGDYSAPHAQCVLCYQTSGNRLMFPTKLQWHLHTKDVGCKDKSIVIV
jgi:hypothetical protein